MRMTDQERVHLVGSFMHFAGDFETPEGMGHGMQRHSAVPLR